MDDKKAAGTESTRGEKDIRLGKQRISATINPVGLSIFCNSF
jgi:hypothetical protein